MKRNATRASLKITNDEFLLGHVGYFLPLKNQKFIVDILARLINNGGKYKLVLIGDGELRSIVEKLVIELGLKDYVWFTGNVENVSDYLNAIDLIVMPSLYEGVPLTLIEQQANGLRCVVADTISKEVDKTGNLHFLSLLKNADFWAKEIESYKDGTTRKERSARAIESIKDAGYSIEEEAENKWNRRSRRVNWDKLLIIGMEQNLCTIDDIKAFDILPFENKIFFSTKELPDVESNCYLPDFKAE